MKNKNLIVFAIVFLSSVCAELAAGDGPKITELTITVKGRIDSFAQFNAVTEYVNHNKSNYEKLGFIIKQGGQDFLMLASATCLKDGLLINLIQDGLVYPSDKPYKLGIGSSLPVDIITVPLIWPAGCLISNEDVFFNFNDEKCKANIVLPKKDNESNIVSKNHLSEQNNKINELRDKTFFYRSLCCLGIFSFVALAYFYKNPVALQFFLSKFSSVK